ncbi:MAG: hypothetical protein HY826_00045 [Actinobacteria bacterium]|nr:hypothetical protein [Actinomycetota bacterium]
MNQQLLPLAVWVQVVYHDVRDRGRRAWAQRHDDAGVDEAVTKMIWLAVGIVVAIAATSFFTAKFNQARDNVPDPIGP